MTTPFPKRRSTAQELLKKMTELKANDWKWKQGRSFSLVYYADQSHQELVEAAYSLYISENCLSAKAFPSLAIMESEVIRAVASLLSDDHSADVCGSITSGGTESAILALKAYRDASQDRRDLEVILSRSTHPAYLKAAHYLGMIPILVDCDLNSRIDLDHVRSAIRAKTKLIVASAPSFSHGVVDPIDELGSMVQGKGIGLHVDASLGGIALPFLKKLGFQIPSFDFRVSQVTSLSVDLHKYGFAAKGASVLLFRNSQLRRNQFFVTDAWSGGLFGSLGVLGTRSGGTIAAAWASLHHWGEEGFLHTFKEIIQTTQQFQRGIESIQGLKIIGNPAMSVFAFTVDSNEKELNIFQIADEMEKRSWHLDRLSHPSSIHLIITPNHTAIVQEFLNDLLECVDIARKNPKAHHENNMLYGVTTDLPVSASDENSIVEPLLNSLEDRLDGRFNKNHDS